MIEELHTLPDGSRVSLEDLKRFAYTTGYFLEERYDDLQLELDQRYEAMVPRTRAFVLMARKIGKSYGLLAYADKKARQNQDFIIRFAYPTETQGKTIILPLMAELMADCPADLRWVNREAQEKCWVLPHTGSRLYLAGTDTADQVDRLRGPRANLIILDELPTFRGNLQYLINSVLWPQTLNTGGLVIMSGTPPDSMEHESVGIIEKSRAKGRLIEKTIVDNPRLRVEDIRSICEEANPDASSEQINKILAGKAYGTPDWEREFKVRMITDDNLRVTPEFREDLHVKVMDTPQYCHRFVFLDPGHVKDFFGATFVMLDYAGQRVIVKRDYQSRRKATDEVMADLLKIEKELGWDPEKLRGREQFHRYIDATAVQQCTDFRRKGYFVDLAVKSPGKSGVVIQLCNRLNANQVLVDPQCRFLVNQLKNGIWKDTAKDDFERTEHMGHLDVLDACAQGLLTIYELGKWRQNPSPEGVYLDPAATSVLHHPELDRRHGQSPVAKTIRRIMGFRRAYAGRR
jgi:hypothetical protein